jgi:hypothetical protein
MEGVLDIMMKTAAPAYVMQGQLRLAKTGWLVLHVPNAVSRGVFATLGEPGVELLTQDGIHNAHIGVMNPEEVRSIGETKITERGRDFGYTLGPIRSTTSTQNPLWSRLWYIEVRSPDLGKLRRSYGLPGRVPGADEFHISVAVRRTNVLGHAAVTKLDGSSPAILSGKDVGERGGSRLFKAAAFATAIVRARRIHDETAREIKARLVHASHDDLTKTAGYGARSATGGAGSYLAGEPLPSQSRVNEDAIHHGTPSGVAAGAGGSTTTTPAKTAAAEALARPAVHAVVKKASLKGTLQAAARRVVAPKSEAQADAGNYQKGHIRMHGLDISIETRKGQKRNPAWPALKHHYGYIKRTLGRDGDHVDVFVGNEPEVELVYVVDQVNPGSRRFDEHKCMLGFKTLADARQAYKDNYSKGWTGLRDITPLTTQQFKRWLRHGDTQKAIAKQTFTVKAAGAGLVLSIKGGIQFCMPDDPVEIS